jgi:hypothetical protein
VNLKSTLELHPTERRFLTSMQELGHGRFELLPTRDGELILESLADNGVQPQIRQPDCESGPAAIVRIFC